MAHDVLRNRQKGTESDTLGNVFMVLIDSISFCQNLLPGDYNLHR